MSIAKQNYYEVLKISQKANIQEIVEAYQIARNAFSKDSLATYSLFSPEEIQENLKAIEEAYSVLSNLHKKVEYDKALLSGDFSKVHTPQPAPSPKPPSRIETEDNLYDTIKETSLPETITGETFKHLREGKNISIEEVSRITKIPLRFLKAIENEDMPQLPARVYIQGFIRNLASLYRIDANKAIQGYLKILEKYQNQSK